MSGKPAKYRVATMRQVRSGGSEIWGWTIETCDDDATPQPGRFYETESEAQAEAKRLADQTEVSSKRT
jgi:hypothetical protein